MFRPHPCDVVLLPSSIQNSVFSSQNVNIQMYLYTDLYQTHLQNIVCDWGHQFRGLYKCWLTCKDIEVIFFLQLRQFVTQQVCRKPITSLEGEIITLKKLLEQSKVLKSEPFHPVAGNADCRQPKKDCKDQNFIWFCFLFAVRKPYWFSDWAHSVHSNVLDPL